MDGGEPQMMSKELQAQLGDQGAGGSVEQMQEAKQQQAAAEQQKAEIMNSILTTEALQRRAHTEPRPLAPPSPRPRPASRRRSPPLTTARAAVGTIKVVKPERAQQVEMMLLQMAQSGKIREKVGEAKIVQLLETVAEKEAKVTVTTIRSGGGGGGGADDDEDDPIAKAMAMGARIPGKDDDSDDY